MAGLIIDIEHKEAHMFLQAIVRFNSDINSRKKTE